MLHSFSIKNIFYDKMDLKLFYFDVATYSPMVITGELKKGEIKCAVKLEEAQKLQKYWK